MSTEPHRYLVVSADGLVVNVVLVQAKEGGTLEQAVAALALQDGETAEPAPEGVGIGWARGDGGFLPPPYDPGATIMPGVISDRQFAHQLAQEGLISKAEALAFVRTGTIPAALQAIVNDVPDPEVRFDAEMLISGATTFDRNHPTTRALVAAWGWDDARADAFWIAAAQR